MNALLARALLAFLVCPGTVAFLIPLWLVAPRGGRFDNRLALVPLGAGIVLLLWCVREFYVAGRGTIAPWAPPRELVVSGLYRFSRNPMYIAVLLVLWGWAVGFESGALTVYALVITAVFHLRVVWFEEPWLSRTHAGKWTQYEAQVPRWIGIRRKM